MKKLFISCPMRGRTEQDIWKTRAQMHQIAEIIMDEELEVVESILSVTAPEWTERPELYFLGQSIKLMSKADCFIGVDSWMTDFPGCKIEADVAYSYGIPQILLPMSIVGTMCPDLKGKTEFEAFEPEEAAEE